MAKERTTTALLAGDLHDMAARGEDRSDLARVAATSEAEFERSIAADPDWNDVQRGRHRGAEAVRRLG